MTDEGFRMWSRRVTLSVSVTYIARGLWLMAVPEARRQHDGAPSLSLPLVR